MQDLEREKMEQIQKVEVFQRVMPTIMCCLQEGKQKKNWMY